MINKHLIFSFIPIPSKMIISLRALDLLLHLLNIAWREGWLDCCFGWLVSLLFVVDLSEFVEVREDEPFALDDFFCLGLAVALFLVVEVLVTIEVTDWVFAVCQATKVYDVIIAVLFSEVAVGFDLRVVEEDYDPAVGLRVSLVPAYLAS